MDLTASINTLVLCSSFLGLLFAIYNAWYTARIAQDPTESSSQSLLVQSDGIDHQKEKEVFSISRKIASGARAFLFREYTYISFFVVIFAIILFVAIGAQQTWTRGAFSTIAFVVGSATSILCGYIGMSIATYANARTAIQANVGIGAAFQVAFRAGTVMGFALVSIALLVLFILINLFKLYFSNAYSNQEETIHMYECLAAYGLGGSCIALFGRVGGGIYTKAADVGADLVGKVEKNIPEDDPRNPAVIADNVGDNVGDIAGMGADLFGSFAESTCAAMVVAAQSADLSTSYAYLTYPLAITAIGILTCFVTTFVSTHLYVVKAAAHVENSLKLQLGVSTVINTPLLYLVTYYYLPSTFRLASVAIDVHSYYVYLCVLAGLWSGLIIGLITEYYTSHSYTPVRDVAGACETGAATNIIYGLALGYLSTIIPVFCIAITIFISFKLAGMFGIACAALGILSTLSVGLTIDAYGPISDNAGGIAEMAGLGPDVRERTDALDAAGNTTAAIGKGFAIGSAAMVSLALFGAYVTTVGLKTVDILAPFVFAGLLVGAMLPYWFSAMTMKSVGKAALAMVQEVREQFRKYPGLMDGSQEPDYDRCVSISTDASLREMIAPGALVMITPLLVGFLLGVEALAGVLVGALLSGVQLAISASNTGGAWDNAKKYIEQRPRNPDPAQNRGKGSEEHKAAVVGDTVGDPLKDTSGPSLNILVKLSAIISLVFAPAFPKGDGYLVQLFTK